MLREIVDYGTTYRHLAKQLATRAIAGDWYRMGVPVETAAAWASLGYYPAEAKPLIDQGITPETAAAVEDAARGDLSPEEHAAQVLDLLAQQGLTIRPADDQQ